MNELGAIDRKLKLLIAHFLSLKIEKLTYCYCYERFRSSVTLKLLQIRQKKDLSVYKRKYYYKLLGSYKQIKHLLTKKKIKRKNNNNSLQRLVETLCIIQCDLP